MFNLKSIEERLGASSGTAFFMLSLIAVKIIGALYKIPLYNFLGSDGIGVYQMVFPLYSLLLTLSGGGIPSGITRLISNGYNGQEVLRKSIKLFLPFAVILCATLFFGAGAIARFQGNENAEYLYKIISPAVIFVLLTGCFRGYFQGLCNFKPTAVSQVVQQVVKCVSGVIALLLVNGSYLKKAIVSVFCVTIAEGITILYLALLYKRKQSKNINTEKLQNNGGVILTNKTLLSFVLPLTLSSLCIPLASFADSFIAINALKGVYGNNATAVYGLYTGGVDSVIAYPVSLLNCLTMGYLPRIGWNKNGFKSVAVVLVLSCIFSVGVFVFCPVATKVLFGSSNEYLALLNRLLRYASLSIILHSVYHALSSLLLSIGKQKVSLIGLALGVAVKIIIDLCLIKLPQINIFGMIISDVGCYFVALVFNLVYIYYINKFNLMGKNDENNLNRIRRRNKQSFGKGAL